MHNRLSHSCHVKQVILTPSGLKSPGPPKCFPAEWITLFIVVARPLNRELELPLPGSGSNSKQADLPGGLSSVWMIRQSRNDANYAP